MMLKYTARKGNVSGFDETTELEDLKIGTGIVAFDNSVSDL